MANLVKKKMKSTQKAKDKNEQATILGFDEHGRPIKEKKPIKKAPIIIVASVAFILGFLYVPSFVKEPVPSLSNARLTTLNSEMIRTATTYFNTYPDEDFDGDGLSNSLEMAYGTNPYSSDSDGDGLTDYTEIYDLNTSPLNWNRDLQSYVLSVDQENEATTGTPYKIGNVILWADNLYSKSYGGVVKVIDGYQFSNFSGWAQFPDSGHAYQYVDGIHKKLEYRADSNAYHIDGTMRVVFFDEDMSKYYKLEAFGNVSYLKDDTFGQILDFVLPDYGNKSFFKCYPVMECDKVGVEREDVELEIKAPEIELTEERFSKNNDSFEDLSKVITVINSGKNVIASLYLDNYGETLIDIYGYTSSGDLLIADLETLTPCGILSINEKCGRMLGPDGSITVKQWFTFNGIGYGSANWARLVFLFEDDTTDTTPFVPSEVETGEPDTTDDNPPETTDITIDEPEEVTSPEETTPQETESEETDETDETSDDTTVPDEDEASSENPTSEDETTEEPEDTGEVSTTAPEENEPDDTQATEDTESETTEAGVTTTENTAFDFSNF